MAADAAAAAEQDTAASPVPAAVATEAPTAPTAPTAPVMPAAPAPPSAEEAAAAAAAAASAATAAAAEAAPRRESDLYMALRVLVQGLALRVNEAGECVHSGLTVQRVTPYVTGHVDTYSVDAETAAAIIRVSLFLICQQNKVRWLACTLPSLPTTRSPTRTIRHRLSRPWRCASWFTWRVWFQPPWRLVRRWVRRLPWWQRLHGAFLRPTSWAPSFSSPRSWASGACRRGHAAHCS